MAASDIQVNISNSAGNVDILVDGKRGIEHNFDKQLIITSIPKQTPILTRLTDIKRLKEIITINGFLEDIDSESGLAKKTTLRSILSVATSCTLIWGTGAKEQSYAGDIVKGSIKETAGRVGDEGSQNKTFSIMIQFAVGTVRG
ncbi:hypothetical protein LCGC14_0598410 [marine sediment metagenome]|uniref:Uncharacterized protein n=1 Tax=marine sediment metagenome TaxID=412755 RepID=A0A0F9RBE7_9ZZZZ